MEINTTRADKLIIDFCDSLKERLIRENARGTNVVVSKELHYSDYPEPNNTVIGETISITIGWTENKLMYPPPL